MIQVGDRVTDWNKGKTFIAEEIKGKFVLDTHGGCHRLTDCMAPDERYESALNEAELAALVKGVTQEIDGIGFGIGTAADLLGWVGLLSPIQKRQLWGELSPDYRAEFQRLKATCEGEAA